MEITKDEKNLIIKIPLKQDIYNPYIDDVVGKMDNIVGVIESDDFGFANYIDMSYKNKGPQLTPMFFHFWQGNKEDFKSLCKKLEIDIYEYPICSKCGKVIYGTYTWDGGDVCSKCSYS